MEELSLQEREDGEMSLKTLKSRKLYDRERSIARRQEDVFRCDHFWLWYFSKEVGIQNGKYYNR